MVKKKRCYPARGQTKKYWCAKVALVLVLATRCSSQKSVPSDYIKPSLVVYSPAQTFPVVLGRALAHTPLRSRSVEEVTMSDSPKITQRRALTVKQILVGLAGDFSLELGLQVLAMLASFVYN